MIGPSGIGRQRGSFMLKASVLMLMGRWGRHRAMRLAVGPAPGRPHPSDRQVGGLALLIARHFRRRRVKVPIFSDDELKRLHMPVLAIVGAQDALLDSHDTKRRLERSTRNATVRWLPEAGHVVRDQADAVVEFLGR